MEAEGLRVDGGCSSRYKVSCDVDPRKSVRQVVRSNVQKLPPMFKATWELSTCYPVGNVAIIPTATVENSSNSFRNVLHS